MFTNQEKARAILHGSRYLSAREREICENLVDDQGFRSNEKHEVVATDKEIFNQLLNLHAAELPAWLEATRQPT